MVYVPLAVTLYRRCNPIVNIVNMTQNTEITFAHHMLGLTIWKNQKNILANTTCDRFPQRTYTIFVDLVTDHF